MESSPAPVDRQEIQRFFRNMAIGLSLVAVFVVWRRGAGPWPWRDGGFVWPWQAAAAMVGIALAAAAYLMPASLSPLHRAFLKIAHAIGTVLTLFLLGFVYYGIFTPVAGWFKMTGRDALQRRQTRDRETYLQPIADRSGTGRYHRQF
jgi:hypothetical protein